MTDMHWPAPVKSIGFRRAVKLDESQAELEQTRLAVVHAQSGDREAFRFLYARYSDNVYGYVRSIVGDADEAEDVTQHVFIKVMTQIDKFDDRGVPFSSWLLRLARNVAIDSLRANRAMPTDVVVNCTINFWANVERRDSINSALRALPDPQREVVFLRHVIGLRPKEIASCLGRSESAVHGLHHRGRLALQRGLADRESRPLTHGSDHLAAA